MRLTRGIASFAALGLIGSQPVFAQYVDNTIALRALPPPPMHFPNPLAMMQQIQAIEAAKAQAARDRAEALLIEQQTAVLQDQRRQGYYQQQQPSSTPQSVAPAPNPIIEKWMMSAQPRMHLLVRI